MPRKVFVAGEILTAADVNTNLMDQAVMVFDDATDRATAIPTPVEGMVTYLVDTDSVEKFDGTDFVPVAPRDGFTSSTTITASDSSFAVPALGSPIVKVTVVGGGGGGGDGSTGSGSDGGTTTFNPSGASAVSAAGGVGGAGGTLAVANPAGSAGLSAGNGGMGCRGGDRRNGEPGNGGFVTVAYLDLTGVSTANVTIGDGGAGATDPGSAAVAGTGGRGEVILEFVAA